MLQTTWDATEERRNICFLTDSYKPSHWQMFPPGTDMLSYYLESRGGEFEEIVWFGLQYILRRHLSQPVTSSQVRTAAAMLAQHYGSGKIFNEEGWLHIVNVHGGWLPLRIKAVAEGTVLPPHNVLMTMENTCPDCFWLPGYLESLFVEVWYPTTVATVSRHLVKTFAESLRETGDPALLPFKVHDFGYRGATCNESAMIGGMAHLVNSMGTDTLQGILGAQRYYGEPMAGFSIPASEHSVVTSWGQDGEVEQVRAALSAFPSGLVAQVGDSYNIFDFVRNIVGSKLRDQILARDGVLVVRPDSGDPNYVVPKVMDALAEVFGYETNEKGFRVLHPKVRVIQGDKMNRRTLPSLLQTLQNAGWSADNLAVGSGGGLLQDVNRDTCRFAMKCSWARVNGAGREVFKAPVTDPDKNSKRGRLKLVQEWGPGNTQVYRTVKEDEHNGPDILREVFKDGQITRFQTFAEIRDRAKITA